MRRRSGFGWLELAIGIVLIGLGILAFAKPDLALTGLVFAYGIAAVVMGVADIILFIQVERYTGFGPMLSLISGVLSVMTGLILGILMVFHPLFTLTAIRLFASAYLILLGIDSVVMAVSRMGKRR